MVTVLLTISRTASGSFFLFCGQFDGKVTKFARGFSGLFAKLLLQHESCLVTGLNLLANLLALFAANRSVEFRNAV